MRHKSVLTGATSDKRQDWQKNNVNYFNRKAIGIKNTHEIGIKSAYIETNSNAGVLPVQS
ncbi:hypothetical protein [Methylocucumis oryzae]|uniref:hypothetical protein n=1 Tax=Methylocucumis oryzae TaxID=1632867 RepID=UPI00103F0C3E|nr:hypothetical protein [Methylocucumis oryzae]